MLVSCKVPPEFWDKFCATLAYLTNLTATSSLQGHTPFNGLAANHCCHICAKLAAAPHYDSIPLVSPFDGIHSPPQLQFIGSGRPDFVISHRVGGHDNLVLIVELKRASSWHNAGKQNAMRQLGVYMEEWQDLSNRNTIYGLCAIGLHWTVCRMEKNGQMNQ